MAGPIFDSHAHYLSRQFDGDRQALLACLPAAGVAGVVECATDLATSKAALALAAAWPFMWAAAGIHPESLIEADASTNAEFSGDWKAELAAIAPLLEAEKVVAVGEIGLDYWRIRTTSSSWWCTAWRRPTMEISTSSTRNICVTPFPLA